MTTFTTIFLDDMKTFIRLHSINQPHFPVLSCMLLLLTFFIAGSASATPEIQHWTTKNGARVLFVSAPELPMLDVRIAFDAGSARDEDKPGLASLTNHLLSFGAGGLNADLIAERFDSIGAQFGSGSARDMAWVTLRTLSDPSLQMIAVNTFAKIISAPAFPEKDFERERKRMLTGLEQQKQSPGNIASKAYYRALYGSHPYASPSEGTEEGLKSITVSDLKKFYERYYVAENATVAIVGNLDREAAEKLSGQLAGHLSAGESAPKLPDVKALDAGRRIHIPHPSTQTHVYIGQPGISRKDPDYFTLYVGNHALGGSGLVSRLSEEIREKRGLSYSVYSYFSPMGQAGPFTMGMQTRNEKTDEGIKVLQDILRTYIRDGMTSEELENSKKNITGGFALRVDSNKKIIEYLAMIGFYELPLDYLDKFIPRINAVKLEDIHKAFRDRINSERMITVTVGGESKGDKGDGSGNKLDK